MKKRSRRTSCHRYIIFLVILGLAGFLHESTAQTLTSFESAVDLSSYTLLTTDATITASQQGTEGAGNPATGGLRIASTTTGDKTAVLRRTASNTAGAVTTFQQSMLFNARLVDNMGTAESKIEARMGFSVPLTITGSLKELLHKVAANDNVNVKLKAEHKPSDTSKLRNIEVEMTSYANAEVKYGKVTLNNSAHFDDWLRLSLTVTRTAATVFTISYTLESLGLDGTSAPVQLATFTQASVTNADFGSATSAQAVFLVNSDKAAGTTWIDDHSFSALALPPPVPVATAATNVTDTDLTATWQSAAGASSYLVEMTTQANNFAPGTFIAQNGTGGQAAGFSVTGTSAAITGLMANTAYVYRIKAVNGAGTSSESNVISATTLTSNANVQPTLDAIANLPTLTPTAPQQTVSLTGISAGFGDTGQMLTVTASSSNTAIIPHPAVLYTSPQSTGALTFTPAGAQGTATITVTVNDGQAMDNTVIRTFTVTVRTPPVEIAFENATDLDEYTVTNLRGSLTHSPAGGIGTPATGGAAFQGLGNGSDQGTLALRSQAYPGPAPTLMRQSILVNFKEINDNPAIKNKGEVRFGFNSASAVTGELKKFFEEGTGRYAVHCKVTAENDPTDSSKDHVIKARVTNWNGSTKTDGEELVISDETIFDHWFKCTFEAFAVGTVQFQLSFKVEDYGPDGSTNLGIVHQSTPVNFVNAGLISAPWIHAGFYLDTEKTTTSKVYADNHRVEVTNLPPEAPVALDAVQITSGSFTSNWSVPSGAYPNSFVVEVVPSASTFAAGNYIRADGIGSQPVGEIVHFSDQRTLRFFGLQANTSYKYRVRAANVAGQSAFSNDIAVTTLTAGSNAQPTLNSITDLEDLAANGGSLVIPLTGISDGGELSQTVSITATSSNPGLIPHPTVSYFHPEETGSLTLNPAFLQSGSATITVTVNDGQATNNTRVRTFFVNVVNPAPAIAFDSASEATQYQIYTTQASLTHTSSEGTATSVAGGGMKFERSTLAAEHVALGFRRVRYDARVIPHASTSLMVNLSSVLTPPTGSKDKAEISLGFISDTTPGTKLKDTFNKTHPSLFAKLKFEHHPAGGKDRQLECEVATFDGVTDSNGGKQSIEGFTGAANWLRLSFHLIRSGIGSYQAWFTLENCGLDGTATPVLIFTSTVQSITNTPFANDSSLYAGFSLFGEKAGTLPFWIDHHTVDVNTTACDAPVNQAAFDETSDGFILPWAFVQGRTPSGYLVELCRSTDLFAPGTLIAEDGTPGQSTGFLVNDPFAADAIISGLLPGQKYFYRVRALRGSEPSATLYAALTQTFAEHFENWRIQWFPLELANPKAQPAADYDDDGLDNATEYALGSNPRAAEATPASSSNVAGSYLRMTFRRRSNLQDVLITPEACGDLASWLSAGIVTVSVSEPDENGIETVTVRDAVPATGLGARFMRLNFTY